MTYISAQVTKNRQSVIVWERDEHGDRDYRVFRAPYYFYYPDEDGQYNDIHSKKLSKLEFNTYRDFYDAKEEFKRNNIKLYESDIGPEYKILSQHYYNKPTGKLNVTFLDIEVDYDKTIGYSTIDNPYAPISAISLYHQYNDTFVVYAVPPTADWTEERIWEEFKGNPAKYVYTDALKDDVTIVLCKDEKQLLRYFLVEIENSDVLSGWNSSFFDMPYIYFRLLNEMGPAFADKLCFPDAKPPRVKEVEKFSRIQKTIELYGRISLDYLELFIKLEQEKRASNSLEAISEELLPDLKKLEYDGPLYDLYRNHFAYFIRYNIRDTEILKGLDAKLKYMQFTVDFSHAATGLPQNILGTIKLTETAIINYCHYELNTIIPDSTENVSSGKFGGAYVLDPQVGMHDYVSGIDIKSLYPSTMRSLNISPDCIIGQFLERTKAYDWFRQDSDGPLTMIYEGGKSETRPAMEWKVLFKSKNWAISGYGTAFDQAKKGFLTDILAEWFDKRIEYQSKIKVLRGELKAFKEGTEEYAKLVETIDYYDKLQYVYKIRLNSIYGCLGNAYFKFYDIRMAESVTRSGREILMHMVRKVGEILDGEYTWPSASALYSDTDSVYFTTHTDNADDALKVAKLLCKQVNESFTPFMHSAFLCNDGFDKLISAEQEIVARTAILIKKKFYVLKIINKNGKVVNETKIMGHAVKKTTLPKAIRKRLIPYIEMIMDNVPWSDIGKQMVGYKDELLNTPNVWDLGSPTGVNKVEQYTMDYNINPKTRLPSGAAAAIFWNQCIEEYKDYENPPISSGMKMKKFKLVKKFGRFSTIAVPGDTAELPEWFKTNFVHLVDRKFQVNRLVDKTMANILEAIGKEMPTKKSLLVDELVEY